MKVAILDDTKTDAQIFLKYIEKFQVERNDTIQADVYEASFDFWEEYNRVKAGSNLEMPAPRLDSARQIIIAVIGIS